MNIEKSSFYAGHCQRNWDHSRFIPDADIETITNVAMNMPTKQNVLQYELIVVKDREKIEDLFEIAVSVQDDVTSGGTVFRGNEFYRNGQVNASLLLIWVTSNHPEMKTNPDWKDSSNSDHFSKCIGVGISAGATALASNHLGYRTGFCNCFDNKRMQQFIDEHTEYGEFFVTSLGIGYPLEGYDRNQTVVDDEILYTSDIKADQKRKIVTVV